VLAGRADVIVAHGSSTLPAVALATPGTGVPFVYRSIGDPLAWVTTAARRARVRMAATRAAAVVALWPGAAVTWHEVLRVPAERLVVIPNAVRATAFSPASPAQRGAARAAYGLDYDGPLVLYLGALSPEKRVDLAIRAVAQVDGMALAVFGDGPERDRLVAMAGGRVTGQVYFRGRTDTPQEAFAAADVVLISSDTEGQPAVAIEAGLAGLPVVATSVGGLASVVADGRTGLLVPPGDAALLARAVRVAFEQREALGIAARERCASHFDLDIVAGRWHRLLDSVVSS
jgi:glycosyltransferase involved in cell wall biosynthesis